MNDDLPPLSPEVEAVFAEERVDLPKGAGQLGSRPPPADSRPQGFARDPERWLRCGGRGGAACRAHRSTSGDAGGHRGRSSSSVGR
jgi:hypothetical protein